MKITIAIEDCSPEALALVTQFVKQVREYGVEVSSPETTQESAEPQLADAKPLEMLLEERHPRLLGIMEKKAGRSIAHWSEQQTSWLKKVLSSEPAQKDIEPAHAFTREMWMAEWGSAMMARILDERVMAGEIPCHPHTLSTILHFIYPMKRTV